MIKKSKSFSKEEKLAQISTLEGYLYKLSPQFLVGYQKRYFCIRDHGQKLIYYKTKPNLKDKPKGMIEIKAICELESKDKSSFSFQYEERKFDLKAETDDERDKWMFAINFLIENYKFEDEKIKIDLKVDLDKKKEKWRIGNIDNQTFNEIQAEHEINLISQQKEQNEPEMNPGIDFNKILELKGIDKYFEKIDSECLISRLCFGFLMKKGKNNLMRYQKRWFILLSAKPLGDKDDGIILNDEHLPPWLELETIYYFKLDSNEDKSPYVGKISLRDCKNISIEDNNHKNILEDLSKNIADFSQKIQNVKNLFLMEKNLNLNKPQNGYGFKLISKNRTYYLYADLITEMNKWIISIEKSRKTYIELHPNYQIDVTEISFENRPSSRTKFLTIKEKKTEPRSPISSMSNSLKTANVNMKDSFPQKNSNSICERPNFQKNSIEEKNQKNVAKEGYLLKKGGKNLEKLIGWKQRYISFKNDTLFWTKSNSDKNVRKVLQLSNIDRCDVIKDLQFRLIAGNKMYKFKAESEDDRDKWVQIISKALLDKLNKTNEEISQKDIIEPKIITTVKKEKEEQHIYKNEEEENNIFSKFFALQEGGSANPSININVDHNEAPPNKYVEKQNKSCWKKIFFCCFKNEEKEENYYSML